MAIVFLFLIIAGAYMACSILFAKQVVPELPYSCEDYLKEGANYYSSRSYRYAEKSYKLALIQAKKLPNPRKLIAKILNELGAVYTEQTRYAEAELMYKEAEELFGEEFGFTDLRVAAVYENWANLYLKQQKFDESEALSKKALFIKQESLGEEHSEVIKASNKLAGFYFQQNKFEEAEVLYRNNIVHNLKNVRPQDKSLVDDILNLAKIYRSTGRSEEADKIEKQLGEQSAMRII